MEECNNSLQIRNLYAGYGVLNVLRDVSFDVQPGRLTLVLGSNGSGKSTLLNALMGLVKHSGSIETEKRDIAKMSTYLRASSGLRLMRDQGDAFHSLTVRENLLAGACLRRDREEILSDLESVCSLFSDLSARIDSVAGMLSGGELRKLSLARAMMARPSIFLLDEPSGGVAPKAFEEMIAVIQSLVLKGCTVLLSEQNAKETMPYADSVIVLDRGVIVARGTKEEPITISDIEAAYLGGRL